jgi:hypothetical protein
MLCSVENTTKEKEKDSALISSNENVDTTSTIGATSL